MSSADQESALAVPLVTATAGRPASRQLQRGSDKKRRGLGEDSDDGIVGV